MKRKTMRDKTRTATTEMADIVIRLRRWAISTDAVPASDIMDEAADEIARLRLTDAEREAIEWAVSAAEDCQHPADDALRGLLERLSPPAT